MKVGYGNLVLSPAEVVTITLYVPRGKEGRVNEPIEPPPLTVPVAITVVSPNVTVYELPAVKVPMTTTCVPGGPDIGDKVTGTDAANTGNTGNRIAKFANTTTSNIANTLFCNLTYPT
jgi:hypothetical protein